MTHTTFSVLVVDDEPAIRQILIRSISAAGFKVTGAADGADALEKLESKPVDIVITDVRMPKLDGLQLLKEIRSRFSDTGVILITGHRESDPNDELSKAGADDLITKPFHNHDIVRKLTQYCQKRAQARPPSPKSAT